MKTKDIIVWVAAIIAFLTGIGLCIAGFYTPPIGDGTTTYEQISVGSTGVTTDRTADLTFTDVMSGNYKMMGAGNITIQQLELGLYKAKYISEVNVWLVEAIHQEVSGTTE